MKMTEKMLFKHYELSAFKSVEMFFIWLWEEARSVERKKRDFQPFTSNRENIGAYNGRSYFIGFFVHIKNASGFATTWIQCNIVLFTLFLSRLTN